MPAQLMTGKTPGIYEIREPVTETELLNLSQQLARRRLRKGRIMDNPEAVALSLQTLLMERPHEIFGLVLLDNRHRMIAFTELFRGTIDASSVYPREVVKEALEHNAAAVILVHNHPAGNPTPSNSDHHITQRVQRALETVDIRVLDHFVVGTDGWLSFAEKGWL
ncbi:RadC family protein [Marinospirillum perlucidum]|uniref:RadC family protein n=1 Tax=Marinospirillum perlucidum TaxID=1982602 RepID=UPI001FE86CF4|nr:DNA repair protein RadC [Marinospirillum perlucidum]